FFFQAEDGIRDDLVTGVQTCALPISILVLVLIWDNASWHKSQIVGDWIRAHNQTVKQTGKGVRILPFLLPTKSPWLNPIEPKWRSEERRVGKEGSHRRTMQKVRATVR